MIPKGPLIKLFGSKWQLSGRAYPKPIHETIVEPFAGSACYALRYADHPVILVEKVPRLAAIWRWLITAPSEEIAALPADLEPGTDLTQLRLRPEALDLIIRWQRTGSSKTWPTHASPWGNKPGQWTSATRDRIARDVECVRHWEILEGDYSQAPNVCASWFIDPPYQHLPDYYGAGKPDYAVLAAWCRARRGQVMVCEQHGAGWLRFEPLCEAVSMARGRRGGNADLVEFATWQTQ